MPSTVQPARDTHAPNGNSPSHDEVQLVWESKAVKTVDPAKKLEELSDENLLTGADALMKAIKKPVKPKRKKRFGCQFCKGIFVSMSNLNKHVATFHVPGAKPRMTRECSLICINCSKGFKY